MIFWILGFGDFGIWGSGTRLWRPKEPGGGAHPSRNPGPGGIFKGIFKGKAKETARGHRAAGRRVEPTQLGHPGLPGRHCFGKQLEPL